MPGLLDQLPRGTRFLILRLRSLGDCVLTTPAIELLKTARPDLRLAVVVEPHFRGVYEGNPHIDELLDPLAGAVARFRPNLCLNLHGGTRSLMLTAVSRARLRAGFEHYRHNWIYNIRIPTAQQILGVDRKVHTAEHVASAVFHLGVPRQEIPRARLYGEPATAHKPYAVIHPMASTPEKTWPAERFLEVARHLERSSGLEPVFISGAGEDLSAFSAHRCVLGASLSEVKSLLGGASLFIGNDSGPAHMAAAFGLPVIVLFGNSDPVVWAPWKTQAEQLIGDGGSILNIDTKEVTGSVERLRVKA